MMFTGKDAAGIANEAIIYAKEAKYDVVLVDTAGRMQDNEPLMRALTKVIILHKHCITMFEKSLTVTSPLAYMFFIQCGRGSKNLTIINLK